MVPLGSLFQIQNEMTPSFDHNSAHQTTGDSTAQLKSFNVPKQFPLCYKNIIQYLI